jgi:predicted choloylglycine hydrolase
LGNTWRHKASEKNVKRTIRIFFLIFSFVCAWTVVTYHRGVYAPPTGTLTLSNSARAHWIPKSELGIHQLTLYGKPYERGYLAGEKTKELLLKQELELVEKLEEFIPFKFLQKIIQLFIMRWFWGIDAYVEDWMKEEMYGVGQWAPKEFDHLADGFTRQLFYHGLHEIGQMMVDRSFEGMGCTVVATHGKEGWIIGRNFDFEGGRVFDSEKIMKWVFPDKGIPYVSVIWAGMVGAVTGVNQRGVYISLNAAGSDDFRRFGTPSTLVLTKALQEAETSQDAVNIIKNETMFITDIFVVSDRVTGELYRVEKSPLRTQVIRHTSAAAVTNHLIGEMWRGDESNQSRMEELTTLHRSKRAMKLLQKLAKENESDRQMGILKILRDKGEEDGKPLHLGNRRAIDPLIATHSVIYNQQSQILYVSQGPAVAGPFVGFDLAKSFETRQPVVQGGLPPDPDVSRETYDHVKESIHLVAAAGRHIKKKNCDEAAKALGQASALYSQSASFYETEGDLQKCYGKIEQAKVSWRKALQLYPPYKQSIEKLEEKLK